MGQEDTQTWQYTLVKHRVGDVALDGGGSVAWMSARVQKTTLNPASNNSVTQRSHVEINVKTKIRNLAFSVCGELAGKDIKWCYLGTDIFKGGWADE